jgi:hypothetical protein
MNNTKHFSSNSSTFGHESARTHPHVFRIIKEPKNSKYLLDIKRKSVQIDKTI